MHKSRSQTIYFKHFLSYCIKQLWTVVKVVWFVLQSLEWLPICNNWDDFFDFSRWNFIYPTNVNAVEFFLHRIRLNVGHHFGGNYCWLLLNAMTLSGILFNQKLVLNTIIIIALWILTSILTVDIRFLVDATYYRHTITESYKPIPTYKLPLDERVRNKFVTS